MTNKAKFDLLEAVQLGNTSLQLWPILGPFIARGLEALKSQGTELPVISLAEVETAASDAGEDLDELHEAIADRKKRDASGG